jgi:peroxiredoxin
MTIKQTFRLAHLALLAGLLATLPTLRAAEQTTDADKAWADLAASRQFTPAPEWKTKEPSPAEQKKYFLPQVKACADKARDFYTKFPTDQHAEQAKGMELNVLSMAVYLGDNTVTPRIEKLEQSILADPKTTKELRFQIRRTAIQRKSMAKGEMGSAEFAAEMEKGVRELQKEFPDQPQASEVSQLLLQIAMSSAPDRAIPLLKEVIANTNATAQVKNMAEQSLKKMDNVGKPLDLKFTAVDGRSVDVQNLKGKVVLLDFWATWCMPCVRELPHVKEAYAELHSKGFEIVGISLDSDKAKLTKFTADQKMEWPQYFDGKQWQNEISTRFGIQSIPAMWLVDKKGNLRDINAREDLKGKIQKLLAE